MSSETQVVLRTLLRILSWILIAIAGIAFWAGGRAISEFRHVDRVLAEMLGLVIAFVAGALGLVLKTKADDLEDEKESPDQPF